MAQVFYGMQFLLEIYILMLLKGSFCKPYSDSYPQNYHLLFKYLSDANEYRGVVLKEINVTHRNAITFIIERNHPGFAVTKRTLGESPARPVMEINSKDFKKLISVLKHAINNIKEDEDESGVIENAEDKEEEESEKIRKGKDSETQPDRAKQSNNSRGNNKFSERTVCFSPGCREGCFNPIPCGCSCHACVPCAPQSCMLKTCCPCCCATGSSGKRLENVWMIPTLIVAKPSPVSQPLSPAPQSAHGTSTLWLPTWLAKLLNLPPPAPSPSENGAEGERIGDVSGGGGAAGSGGSGGAGLVGGGASGGRGSAGASAGVGIAVGGAIGASREGLGAGRANGASGGAGGGTSLGCNGNGVGNSVLGGNVVSGGGVGGGGPGLSVNENYVGCGKAAGCGSGARLAGGGTAIGGGIEVIRAGGGRKNGGAGASLGGKGNNLYGSEADGAVVGKVDADGKGSSIGFGGAGASVSGAGKGDGGAGGGGASIGGDLGDTGRAGVGQGGAGVDGAGAGGGGGVAVNEEGVGAVVGAGVGDQGARLKGGGAGVSRGGGLGADGGDGETGLGNVETNRIGGVAGVGDHGARLKGGGAGISGGRGLGADGGDGGTDFGNIETSRIGGVAREGGYGAGGGSAGTGAGGVGAVRGDGVAGGVAEVGDIGAGLGGGGAGVSGREGVGAGIPGGVAGNTGKTGLDDVEAAGLRDGGRDDGGTVRVGVGINRESKKEAAEGGLVAGVEITGVGGTGQSGTQTWGGSRGAVEGEVIGSANKKGANRTVGGGMTGSGETGRVVEDGGRFTAKGGEKEGGGTTAGNIVVVGGGSTGRGSAVENGESWKDKSGRDSSEKQDTSVEDWKVVSGTSGSSKGGFGVTGGLYNSETLQKNKNEKDEDNKKFEKDTNKCNIVSEDGKMDNDKCLKKSESAQNEKFKLAVAGIVHELDYLLPTSLHRKIKKK